MKSTKYKDSPLGPIPQDWEVKRLGDVADSLGNNTYAREHLCGNSTNAFNIHYGDILIKYGSIVDFARDQVPCLRETVKPNKDFLNDGDIVFADTAEDEVVGKAVEIRGLNGRKSVAGLHTMAYRPHKGIFASNFLGYYLNSSAYHTQLLPLITGSKVSSLSRANFESSWLTFPPLPEQQRIVQALGEVDKLIESLDEQIEKKRLIAKGVAHDLLSAKKRLPGFKGAWEMLKLGDMGIWLKGQALSKSDVTSTGTYECIHYGELFTKYGPVIQTVVSRTDKEPTISSVSGDILFPSSDVTPEGLGRCSAIMADGVILGGDMIILRLGVTCSPQLVSHVINQNRRMIIAKVTGITVRHITSKALSNIEIPLPPTFAEQQAIADLLSEQDAAIAALEAKREKYARIKEGMMRDLLTGKKRMKGE